MRRRTALELLGGLSLGLTAGCLESLDVLRREDAWRELVVDPPEGSYVPPEIDAMTVYGDETAAGRKIQLLATRPHSFWTVSGRERERADLRSDHSLHFMARVVDAETGVIVPGSVAVDVRRNGDHVDERTLWPMLSQRMGFHYGDNLSLEGDGAYEVTLRVSPPGCRTTDAFADRLEQPATAAFEIDYSSAAIEGLERTLLDADEGRGERGALEPMAMELDAEDDHDPATGHAHDRLPEVAPPLESLPGEPVGVATGGDLVAPAVVTDGFRSVTDDPYLAIVPQTAYNGYHLPFASLSAVAPTRAEIDKPLRETIDPELGHHYGAALESAGEVAAVDDLSVVLESPPQLSRHEGYETALLERVEATVGDDGHEGDDR